MHFVNSRAVWGKVILALCLSSFWISGSEIACGCSAIAIKPGRLYGSQMVFDPIQNQLILCGGTQKDLIPFGNPTWLYQISSESWIHLSSDNFPRKRINHGMVYEPVTQRVILFGGDLVPAYERVAETWAFDPARNTWTELTPILSPPAMSDMGMYYDPICQKVILFGGYIYNDTKSDDTWAFDPLINTWEKLSTNTPPDSRYGHSMEFDPILQQGLLFGGRVYDLSAETWGFNSSSRIWTRITTYPTPVKRYCFNMVFDSYLNHTMLFGGTTEDSSIRRLNDTWYFDAGGFQWVDCTPSVSPSRRINHAMEFVPSVNKSFMFGGMSENMEVILCDFWAFDSAHMEWVLLSPCDSRYGFHPAWFILIIGVPVLGIAMIILLLLKRRHMKHVDSSSH